MKSQKNNISDYVPEYPELSKLVKSDQDKAKKEQEQRIQAEITAKKNKQVKWANDHPLLTERGFDDSVNRRTLLKVLKDTKYKDTKTSMKQINSDKINLVTDELSDDVEAYLASVSKIQPSPYKRLNDVKYTYKLIGARS